MNFLPCASSPQINLQGGTSFLGFFCVFHRSAFLVLLCSAETRVGKAMENLIRWFCVYMWSACKCSAVNNNGCFLSKNKPKKSARKPQPCQLARAPVFRSGGGPFTSLSQVVCLPHIASLNRIVDLSQKVCCRVKRSVCLHVWRESWAEEVEPTGGAAGSPLACWRRH